MSSQTTHFQQPQQESGTAKELTTRTALDTSISSRFIVLNCSIQQEELIYKYLGPGQYWHRRKKMAAPMKSFLQWETNCPDPVWLDQYYNRSRLSSTQPFYAINVGCNKGFDAIRLARMGMKNPIFQSSSWDAAFGTVEQKPACGADRRHEFPLFQQQQHHDDDELIRKGQVHCIEALPVNVKRLESTMKALHLNEHGFVVTHAAISNASGTIMFPDMNAIGDERGSLDSCQETHHTRNENCTSVPMYSLDDYARMFLPKNVSIDIMLVDAEGFDYDVLSGGKETLKRVQYLEFEYHTHGSWATHNVLDAMELLEQQGDFICYWAGRRARGGDRKPQLWRITGCTTFMDELFSMYRTEKAWSNVACVRKSQITLANMMENVFLQTIKEEPDSPRIRGK